MIWPPKATDTPGYPRKPNATARPKHPTFAPTHNRFYCKTHHFARNLTFRRSFCVVKHTKNPRNWDPTGQAKRIPPDTHENPRNWDLKVRLPCDLQEIWRPKPTDTPGYPRKPKELRPQSKITLWFARGLTTQTNGYPRIPTKTQGIETLK